MKKPKMICSHISKIPWYSGWELFKRCHNDDFVRVIDLSNWIKCREKEKDGANYRALKEALDLLKEQ